MTKVTSVRLEFVKSIEESEENDMEQTIEEMIKNVEKLSNNTPDGQIIDADTLLVDLIQNCDYEFSGIAQDIFGIWKQSADKRAVEQMFFEFTGVEFDTYLTKCMKEISR